MQIRVHERVHTGDKPYKCAYCDYRSAQVGNTRIHERRHTGVKPYPCPLCPFAAVTSSATYAHMKSMHPGVSVELKAVLPAARGRRGAGSVAPSPAPQAPAAVDGVEPMPAQHDVRAGLQVGAPGSLHADSGYTDSDGSTLAAPSPAPTPSLEPGAVVGVLQAPTQLEREGTRAAETHGTSAAPDHPGDHWQGPAGIPRPQVDPQPTPDHAPVVMAFDSGTSESTVQHDWERLAVGQQAVAQVSGPGHSSWQLGLVAEASTQAGALQLPASGGTGWSAELEGHAVPLAPQAVSHLTPTFGVACPEPCGEPSPAPSLGGSCTQLATLGVEPEVPVVTIDSDCVPVVTVTEGDDGLCLPSRA